MQHSCGQSGSIFYFDGKNMEQDIYLKDIELVGDDLDSLLDRNRRNPVPVNTKELFKTNREQALDDVFKKFLGYGLSPYQILSPKKVPSDKLELRYLYQYWETKYPSPKQHAHKNYYSRSFKKQVEAITGKSVSDFEVIDKSDCYKVATLCRRLSQIFERGLMLLAPHKKKDVAVESRPYLPSKFSPETLIHSCFMSELFTDLLYHKPENEKAFLKNMDLSVGKLIELLEYREDIPKSVNAILRKESLSVDCLSVHLVKSWVINEKLSFFKANTCVIETLNSIKQQPHIDYDFVKGHLKSSAEVLWNYHLCNVFSYYKERIRNEDYPVPFAACKLKELEELSPLYIHKLEKAIAVVESSGVKLKTYIHNETSPPSYLIAKLSKFAAHNEGVNCLSISLAEVDEKSSFIVKCKPLKLSRIPELHLQFWGLLINKTLTPQHHNKKSNNTEELVLNWLRNNNVNDIMEGFGKLEKLLGQSIVPTLSDEEVAVDSFDSEGSFYTIPEATDTIKKHYGPEYKYLKRFI